MGLFKKMVKTYYKVKINRKVSYDELIEMIKEGNYPIGKPSISGEGIMRAIRFEAIGKYQIMVSSVGKTITVSKSYSNAESFVKIAAMDAVTDGWYNSLNTENLEGNEAVEIIGIEIARLLKAEGVLA